jgi:predicted N-formylglutamate amidohydrolase
VVTRLARARTPYVLVTCEHGGNRIPAPYRALFRDGAEVLASHRGYDPGALDLARALAAAFDAPLIGATVSRLLVELNRSPRHPQCFSEFTRGLAPADRQRIAARYYAPYRNQVTEQAGQAIAAGRRVVHLSAHSFTPVLDGVVRNADVGLLYDPACEGERRLCEYWAALLQRRIAPLRVRRNYPYRGSADGLTTSLRRRFAAGHYAGIEIEANQKHYFGPAAGWRRLRAAIVDSALEALQAPRPPRTATRPASIRQEQRA